MAEEKIKRNRDQYARRNAREAGLKTYFTGRACDRGHFSDRRTSSGICLECSVFHQSNLDKNKERERLNRWRALNSGKVTEQNKRSWANNNVNRRASTNKYKSKNPDVVAACVRRRRARKCGANGNVSASDFIRIVERQKFKCAWCGASIRKKRHFDHIMPLVRGGAHVASNLAATCPTCNLRKNAKHPVAWAQEIGLLI